MKNIETTTIALQICNIENIAGFMSHFEPYKPIQQPILIEGKRATTQANTMLINRWLGLNSSTAFFPVYLSNWLPPVL